MFPTGHKNFWIMQLIGWGLVAATNLFIQSYAELPVEMLVFNSLGPFISGILVTSVYRYLIYKRKWQYLSIPISLGLVLLSTVVLTATFILVLCLAFQLVNTELELGIITLMSNSFIFGIIMLAWCMIYFVVHYFNHWNQAEIEKWKLIADMKEAQLGSLKSQINPHFVFNALNNIRSLILEDKEKARGMLLNFSDLFRYSLQQTEKTKVTVEEELEMVNQYFELLSIQYEDKLQYKITVDDNVKANLLPPMMLQLLVENAVKHGISQYKEGGSILVKIQKKNEHINISVKNTGNLAMSSRLGDKLGVGLENIRKRLEILYSGEAKLKLREVNEFVEAAITIPIL